MPVLLPKKLRLFFSRLTLELDFTLKEIYGRLVKKQFEGESIEMDRRYFEYENDDFILQLYAFTKNPELKDLPLSLRGKVLRKDFIEIEKNFSRSKPAIRKFINEPYFGLGYQTPIDHELHFDWGQVGCFNDLPSRHKCTQFQGDLVASIKRMKLFDKNARIKGELTSWSQKSQHGVLKTDTVKKVFMQHKEMPEAVKNPKPGLKLNLRILRSEGKFIAHDVTRG